MFAQTIPAYEIAVLDLTDATTAGCCCSACMNAGAGVAAFCMEVRECLEEVEAGATAVTAGVSPDVRSGGSKLLTGPEGVPL